MANQLYTAILTNTGLAEVQKALWAHETLEVVYMGYGDGGGAPYTPTPDMTDLKHRLDLVDLQNCEVDVASGVTWFEAIIGAEKANGTIRELGLYTADMKLIAIANTPEVEKVAVSSGALIDIPVSLGIKNSISQSITIPMQPSDEFATKEWVYDAIEKISVIDCGTF